jgi:peroxiredoxin
MVLGIDDEVPGRIASFRTSKGVTYPTLLDPNRKVHSLFGVDGIPVTFVFDREGRCVGRVPYPHDEKNFRAVLKKAGLE